MAQQTKAVQPKGVALLGLAQGFEEGGAVGVVAEHGWAIVAPVPCVVHEPIGHDSRLASHPSQRAVGRVRQQKNELTPLSPRPGDMILTSQPRGDQDSDDGYLYGARRAR